MPCLIYLDHINTPYHRPLWRNPLNQIHFVVSCAGERSDKFAVNVNLHFEDSDYSGLLISPTGEANGGDTNGIGSPKLNSTSFSSLPGSESLSSE